MVRLLAINLPLPLQFLAQRLPFLCQRNFLLCCHGKPGIERHIAAGARAVPLAAETPLAAPRQANQRLRAIAGKAPHAAAGLLSLATGSTRAVHHASHGFTPSSRPASRIPSTRDNQNHGLDRRRDYRRGNGVLRLWHPNRSALRARWLPAACAPRHSA